MGSLFGSSLKGVVFCLFGECSFVPGGMFFRVGRDCFHRCLMWKLSESLLVIQGGDVVGVQATLESVAMG